MRGCYCDKLKLKAAEVPNSGLSTPPVTSFQLCFKWQVNTAKKERKKEGNLWWILRVSGKLLFYLSVLSCT